MDASLHDPISGFPSRTKIVATVGPACAELEQLSGLFEAGVDVFRLNMAHGELDEHAAVIQRVRSISQTARRPIGVLVDLAGPKIRLGEIAGDAIECVLDDEFVFVGGAPRSDRELGSTYPSLVDELATGDVVMLADGTVSMKVIEKQAGRARSVVTQAGTIRSRQGINLPGVKLRAAAMSDEDRGHARWAVEQGVDFISLSFVRAAGEVRQLRELVKGAGGAAHVIAKIEKREALDEIDAIVREADGVMVARGDLGVEIDLARAPLEQKRIIKICREYQRPVIVATQMLESMVRSARPTRAEATDVANAILDGCDACMLSGETAIGEYPRQAVATMNRIALATEESFRGVRPQSPPEHSARGLHEVTRAVVAGAGRIAHELDVKLIAVASHSGAASTAVSNQRNYCFTLGLSDSPATLGRMCLAWGVMPLVIDPGADMNSVVKAAEDWGCSQGYLSQGDRIVIVCGARLGAKTHDVVTVHTVRSAAK
jgi:pyruvate kinase